MKQIAERREETGDRREAACGASSVPLSMVLNPGPLDPSPAVRSQLQALNKTSSLIHIQAVCTHDGPTGFMRSEQELIEFISNTSCVFLPQKAKRAQG